MLAGGVRRRAGRSRRSRLRPVAWSAKSSRMSRSTLVRRRISASRLLSSRAAFRRLNSLAAGAMCTVRRRRTAMCPRAQARWVLPTPTGPEDQSAVRAVEEPQARPARSRAAGRSGWRRSGPRCPAACRRPARRRGPAATRTSISRRVTSSARTSSRKSAWVIFCCRARVSRSGRVSSIWPSLSAFSVVRRSGLTTSRRHDGHRLPSFPPGMSVSCTGRYSAGSRANRARAGHRRRAAAAVCSRSPSPASRRSW